MTDDDDDGAFVASVIIIIPQLINTFRYYSSVPRYVDPSTTKGKFTSLSTLHVFTLPDTRQ